MNSKNISLLSSKVYAAVRANMMETSGLPSSSYLPMSRISQCPRKLVLWLQAPRRASEVIHGKFYVERLFETDALARFERLGFIEPQSGVEVKASFDERYRGFGHAVCIDGALFYIRATGDDNFRQTMSTHRVRRDLYLNVQSLMWHGGFSSTLVIYIHHDTFEHNVLHVPLHEPVARDNDRRAQAILAHFDLGTLPECECGRCGDSETAPAPSVTNCDTHAGASNGTGKSIGASQPEATQGAPISVAGGDAGAA